MLRGGIPLVPHHHLGEVQEWAVAVLLVVVGNIVEIFQFVMAL